MSETTLRQLSRDFARGAITVEEYRSERAKLLNGLVDGTIALKPFLPHTAADETVTEPATMPAQKSAKIEPTLELRKKSGGMRWVAVVVAFVAGGGAAYFLATHKSAPVTATIPTPAPVATAPASATAVRTVSPPAAMIQAFLEKKDWEPESLDRFFADWTKLELAQRQAAGKTPLYKHLSDETYARVAEAQTLIDLGGAPDAVQRQKHLLEFASDMGFQDPRFKEFAKAHPPAKPEAAAAAAAAQASSPAPAASPEAATTAPAAPAPEVPAAVPATTPAEPATPSEATATTSNAGSATPPPPATPPETETPKPAPATKTATASAKTAASGAATTAKAPAPTETKTTAAKTTAPQKPETATATATATAKAAAATLPATKPKETAGAAATTRTEAKKPAAAARRPGTLECRAELARLRRPYCRDGLASGGLGPLMVVLRGGTFSMGGDAPNAGPAHKVTIAHSFAISMREIAADEYGLFCKASGRTCPSQPWSADYPVVNVSWDDAVAYTKWLSKETGRHYRLPTEAEWEYSARAGSTGRYPSGDELLPTDARFSYQRQQTSPLPRTDRTINRNRFRLYNMLGNVREWVLDGWHDSYQGAPTDGSAWTGGSGHVVRGGSYRDGADKVQSASREKGPAGGDRYTGFRVVQEISATPATGTTVRARNVQWIAEQGLNQYTLQLFAVNHIASVEKIIARHPQLEIMIMPSENPRQRYRVYYGIFDTRAEARRAFAKLPKDILSQVRKPLLQSFAQLSHSLVQR